MSIRTNVSVDVKGFNRMLKQYPREVRRAVRRKMSGTIGPRLVRRVKRKTRVRTGRLRSSTYQRMVPQKMAIDIGYHAQYARYVEGRPINDDVLGTVARDEQAEVNKIIQEAVDKAATKVSTR